jgi:hypothetical protein
MPPTADRGGLQAPPAVWPRTVDGRRRPVAERSMIWGRGRDDDVAWWDPRVGKGNRETAGANYVLGVEIFLLHPQ